MGISCVLAQFFNSLQQRPLNNLLPYWVQLTSLEIRIRIGTEQREEHIYNWGHKSDREESIVLYIPLKVFFDSVTYPAPTARTDCPW